MDNKPAFASYKVLVAGAFTSCEAAQQWVTASACLATWIAGPKSLNTWSDEQKQAHLQMIAAAKCCLSPVVQQVLDVAAFSQQDITIAGHWVYALVSPLWGKCYVGACGMEGARCPLMRWMEHIKLAVLWSSSMSRRRCASRCPALYSAMGSVSVENVIMLVLAARGRRLLPQAERYFIRKLQPVFSEREVQDAPYNVLRTIAPTVAEDVVVQAARILRQTHPKLSALQWTSLISNVAASGERALAAKLARHARAVCSRLGKVRAFPQVAVPCALPRSLMRQMQHLLTEAINRTPGFARTPQFGILLSAGRICWQRSIMCDCLVAPAVPKFTDGFSCKCRKYASSQVDGHLCTRKWGNIKPCQGLYRLVGDQPMSCRLYPPLNVVVGSLGHRVNAKLRMAGMDMDTSSEIAANFVQQVQQPLQRFWGSLPTHLHYDSVKQQLRPVLRTGLVFVRIDRNPGRVVLMCRSLWLSMQMKIFLNNARYKPADIPLCSDDSSYSRNTTSHFEAFLKECGVNVKVKAPAGAARPRGYWTIKQKSLLLQDPAVAKFRPIIAHHLHPCRAILRRIGRALSLLVALAVVPVKERHPHHLPMWRMHHGASEWLKLLRTQPVSRMAEFDVKDCFLNTPRALVMPALRFWLSFRFHNRRSTKYFAISKDNNAEDYVGRPCSIHYWEVSATMLMTVVEWELANNSLFEVVGVDGVPVVLQQDKGLPIGGHLSAALVELVALYREYTQPWPPLLEATISMRYRDNFFVGMQGDHIIEMNAAACELSELLAMPIKPEGVGKTIRCLELRLTFSDNDTTRCTLAFRTDDDRQGESWDVSSWPLPDEPRTRLLLPALLAGLAAKMRFYTSPGVAGYTETVRKMYAFLRGRGYPRSWWMRGFALALTRCGVPIGCLPRPLRTAMTPKLIQ